MMQAKKKKTSLKIWKRIVPEQRISDSEEELSPVLTDEVELANDSISDDGELAKVNQPSDIKEGDFALVRFYGRRSVQHYMGQVINVFEDGDLTFRFLKRSCQSTSVSECPTFILPQDTDNNAFEFTQSLEDNCF